MRDIAFIPKVERLAEMTQLYGNFDLNVNTGKPTEVWERRNLQSLRLPFDLRHVWFDGWWMRRVQVNRRASEALNRVYLQIHEDYTPEARKAHGLDQFVRCYCFGDSEPSLFWYGAAWELSPQTSGETLAEVTKIFVRHGWTYCGLNDRKRFREFEYW